MSDVSLTFGAAFVLAGAAIILLCLPLLKDKIKPNYFYGIRLPKSFESDECWYKMNRYGAKQMIIYGAILMALGIVAAFLPVDRNTAWPAIIGFAPVVLVLIPALRIYRYSKTL